MLFYPGPGHPPRPDLVSFHPLLYPTASFLREPGSESPTLSFLCILRRTQLSSWQREMLLCPGHSGIAFPPQPASQSAALTKGPKRTGGAGYKPRPLAQAQGGTPRPPFPSQRINRSSTEESVNAKSLRQPLSMCAAEVDRHVAQRYLIKRRLGKGVSAGTPRHPRGTAVTWGSGRPPQGLVLLTRDAGF